MKWLVTAFEPFGQTSSNSSLEVLKSLEKLEWRGQIQFHSPVPVVFSSAWPDVESALQSKLSDVDGVLALGQAGGRSKIGLERLALNWVESNTLDNSGRAPSTGKISQSDGDLLWTNIPWTDFKPSQPQLFETSFSAGVYVCNYLMFHSLKWAKANGKLAGFVHIPHLASRPVEGQPSLDDTAAIQSIAEALQFLVRL